MKKLNYLMAVISLLMMVPIFGGGRDISVQKLGSKVGLLVGIRQGLEDGFNEVMNPERAMANPSLLPVPLKFEVIMTALAPYIQQPVIQKSLKEIDFDEQQNKNDFIAGFSESYQDAYFESYLASLDIGEKLTLGKELKGLL